MTIEINNADITIVLEANVKIQNKDRIIERKNMFANYHLEDKVMNNQNKARISIVIKKNIPYTWCPELESENNSSIFFKVKEAKNKFTFVV